MRPAFNRLVLGLKKRLGLSPEKSLAALRKERERIKFMDVQRRISMYLRGLWGRDFVIRPTEVKFESLHGCNPFVEDSAIHVPAAYYELTRNGDRHFTGLEFYRAASAHAAAHIVYSRKQSASDALDQLQKASISTIEDARVETLAIRRFPGLKRLWAAQHTATPEHHETADDYLDRLARALLDETYADDDPWINQGRELFKAADSLEDDRIARDIGMALAHELQKRNIRFKADSSYVNGAAYRDDNRHLWESAKPVAEEEQISPTTFFESKILSIWEFARFGYGEKRKSAMTFYDAEFLFAEDGKPGTDEDTEAIPELESDENINKLSALLSGKSASGETTPETYYYSEWNFRSQNETESWVTLREMNAKPGDLQIVDNIIEQNNHLLSRMKILLNAIRYGGVHRVRKLEEGDEIDINAAIRSQIDIRLGVQPDPRIMMRTVRKTRDISVLLLLDLSKSTNEKVQGQEHTVLELTQQVCVLFSDAIKTVGDPFAIHGFCSESRHNVEYYRLKDFDQPYDDVPKARIAGMTGQRATRMGAAIRHATYHLNKQHSRKKLLILITDGAPDDIDVRGEEYLRWDTKKAVEAAGRSGINTFCISLDPRADRYVSRIFGARNYMVVDHVRCLPEKMLMLYAGLTR
jgi:nitric oxide reductase NorD protein